MEMSKDMRGCRPGRLERIRRREEGPPPPPPPPNPPPYALLLLIFRKASVGGDSSRPNMLLLLILRLLLLVLRLLLLLPLIFLLLRPPVEDGSSSKCTIVNRNTIHCTINDFLRADTKLDGLASDLRLRLDSNLQFLLLSLPHSLFLVLSEKNVCVF